MKEILIKRRGDDIAKISFSQAIMDEYEQYKDEAAEKGIVFTVIGSDTDISPNSIIITIEKTGAGFKKDVKTGGDVHWFLCKVEGTTISTIPIGTAFWFKIPREELANHGFVTPEQVIAGMIARKLLMVRPSFPKKRGDSDVMFIFYYEQLRYI